MSEGGGHPNERQKSSTYEMELCIPHCIYTEESKKSDVWGKESSNPRDRETDFQNISKEGLDISGREDTM